MAECGDMQGLDDGGLDDGGRGGGHGGASSARSAATLPRSRTDADAERDDPIEADAVAIARDTGAADAEVSPGLPAPALRFDWSDWLPYLEDQDVPEEQKRELIETLWSIVVSFVDIGWHITPNTKFSGEIPDLKAILTAANTGNGKEAV